jgi:BirA family biotin operon repressor/biotin-[acetyl-CoA-carboxylase] ligase
LDEILTKFGKLIGQNVRRQYLSRLYRRQGYHPFVDQEGAFMAELTGVEEDGHLLLLDDNGRQRRYAFKEVTFVI